MAFTVTTYYSEDDLAAAITAVVTTYPDEETLGAGILTATTIFDIIAHGEMYTIIDNPQIVNVSLRVIGKGGFYTVILETA